jgi:hypothetical protein
MKRLAMLVIALTVMLILQPAGHGLAQNQQPEATKIDLTVDPALDDRGHALAGQYAVTVVLTTADGRYVANQPIQIVETVNFFGARSETLGSAVTDGTGNASVLYQPSQVGSHKIVARFAGDNQYAASTSNTTLDATTVVPPFAVERSPLASVGTWLSVFLAVLGVAFWIVLLGVLGRTVWRIRSAAGATRVVIGPDTAVALSATGPRD